MTAPDNRTEFEAIANNQAAGKKIVFTNGCFDILHVGHARYLAEARALGDLLVVGINSDRSVTAIKGPGRPLNTERERKEMLLALRSVDYVCVFDEELPLRLIQQVHPDVLVKGGDWTVDRICGADFVSAYGGQVLSLPYHKGFSTSSVIERIKESR